jgi:uncharacterized protein (TIGR02453 family)
VIQDPSFTKDLFEFLADLRRNNNREWFQANKRRYEQSVQDPALEFISDFAPLLDEISSHFRADPRPSGGSLFRIYRDVRFSKDKSPYKTQTGIRFRHRLGKDVHAPVYYLHLEPGQSFAGVGIWHPDSATLGKIRGAIMADPDTWLSATRQPPFAAVHELGGDALKRAPSGYDPDHPLIEDLKRKDFVSYSMLDDKTVTGDGFLDEYARICRSATPFVAFLCRAVEAPF